MARDESPEVIEKEMEQTRASLADKVQALESQVVGTIHNATETVSTTVDTVREAVQDITSTVKDTLTDSAATVKNTLTGGVTEVSESIKSTFDFTRHTRDNPWGMVGGAAAVGFVAGLLASGRKPASATRSYTSLGREAVQPGQSHGVQAASYGPTSGTPSYAASTGGGSAGASFGASLPKRPGWVDALLERAGDEIRKVAEVALTSASASLKQAAEQQLPKLLSVDTLSQVGQRLVGDHGESHRAGTTSTGSYPPPAAGYATPPRSRPGNGAGGL